MLSFQSYKSYCDWRNQNEGKELPPHKLIGSSCELWRDSYDGKKSIAEIERLEKEVDRLTVLLMKQDSARERNGWNDAIEAAADMLMSRPVRPDEVKAII